MTSAYVRIASFKPQLFPRTHQRQVDLILGYIKRTGASWTRGELAYVLGMEKSTMSARVNKLLEDGLLVEVGIRKCGRSQRLCQTLRAV